MVNPVGKQDAAGPRGETREQSTKQALQLLQNIEVHIFFINLFEEERKISLEEGTSLRGKIEEIESELESGKTNLSLAIEKLNSLTSKFENKNKIEFPKFNYTNPNDSPERVAEQLFAFYSFVKALAEKEGCPICHAKGLINDLSTLQEAVHNKTMPAQEGLAQLIWKINETNEVMPPSIQYPVPQSIAYL